MTRDDFINNSPIIQKCIKKLDQNDLNFLYAIWSKAIDPKCDEHQIRFKQLLYHMCAWLNIFELARLKKAFNTLLTL